MNTVYASKEEYESKTPYVAYCIGGQGQVYTSAFSTRKAAEHYKENQGAAPYQVCTRKQFDAMMKANPELRRA